MQDLPVASLPPYYQAQVTAGIEVASVDAARVTVEQLREMARRCAQPTPPPRPDPRRRPPATPEAHRDATTTTGGPVRYGGDPDPHDLADDCAAADVDRAPTTPAPSPLPGQGC